MLIIPLRTIRYSDKYAILNAYTRENGRSSFLIPDGEGKRIAARRALFQPLFPIEGEVYQKRNQEFGRIHEPHPLFPLYGLIGNPLKQSIALFLADVLSALLRHPEPDSLLFDFITDSVRYLNDIPISKASNFHIVFIYKLAQFMGIAPDIAEYNPGAYFDMRDSTFRLFPPLHRDFLDKDSSTIVPLIERLDFRSMHVFKITRTERNEILDHILRYYEVHEFPISPLRSLDILRSLF